VRWEHSLISLNAGSMLRQRLAKSSCRTALSPLRLRVSPKQYLIPDMMVVCGKPALTDEHQAR